ncbi:MAG TPA: hypothetical protein ENI92_08115 [Bacteroidetes bacterium]|nr:hypothetical protein [Bacteroidota bacterium]
MSDMEPGNDVLEASSDVPPAGEYPDETEAIPPLGDKVIRVAGKVAKGLSTGAGSVSAIVRGALDAREHVLMVRVNSESLEKISNLKEAGLFKSRSEAAAYLIAEGIASRKELFDHIEQKIREIQQIRDELRNLAEEQGEPFPESE